MQNAARRSGTPATMSFTSLRSYIYWSTMVSIFSSALVIRVPFTIRLFDGIMLVNLLLMFLIVNFARIPGWILGVILYLAMSGGIGIAHGTDTLTQVAKEFLGISVCLLYFFYFFKMITNDFERAFFSYAKIAFWFAFAALPLWIGTCIYSHRYVRLQGLTPEPFTFCLLVLPAYYWYSYLYFTYRKHGGKVAIFTLAIMFSGSSNGYLGVAFGAALLLSGRMKHFVFVPVVVGALLGLAYTVSPDFRTRAVDTLLAISTQDVSGSNYSTYALMSNVLVTQEVLKESPIIGNGVGSHPISHERFIGNVPGVERFLENNSADLNATEAASLTLRTLSEFGILGFSGVLIFLFHFHVGGTGYRAGISNAILTCFFLKLLRDGLYFPPEQFFFIFIYIFNHRQDKLEIRSIDCRAPSRLLMKPLDTR
jgi:hypothetical protein